MYRRINANKQSRQRDLQKGRFKAASDRPAERLRTPAIQALFNELHGKDESKIISVLSLVPEKCFTRDVGTSKIPVIRSDCKMLKTYSDAKYEVIDLIKLL